MKISLWGGPQPQQSAGLGHAGDSLFPLTPTKRPHRWFLGFCMALMLVGSGACGDDDATACAGEPGSAGCACRGDMSCDEGLACTMANVCAPEMRVGLAIPAGAQGCDVLLTSAGDVRVTFGDAVEGTWISERPNHAISAVATAGELGSGAIEVAAAQDFTIASGACVDSTGAAVGEVTR